MNYQSTLDFLYNRLQSFHNQGAAAYKPGLERTLALSEAFGSPHENLRVVHVGGTNGKGSTAHSVAAVLQSAGLKVGLYTSPHLVDFRERIRVNGEPISEDEVVRFVEYFCNNGLKILDPSFFELTTIMAFDHFYRHEVDIAVVEVGLGGRLDSTNIVKPLVTTVTNISFDHTALLGNTLAAIAGEKAGIFKENVPAVVGRKNPETDTVFRDVAKKLNANLIFAPVNLLYKSSACKPDKIVYEGTPWGQISSELTGECQPENMGVILNILSILQKTGIVTLDNEIINRGLNSIIKTTGLLGRWMRISTNPLIIADTAHNPDGWRALSRQLSSHLPKPLAMVIGFVNDKDISGIIELLPREATYFFVRPSVQRGAPSENILKLAKQAGINGQAFNSVTEGAEAAIREFGNKPESLIFIGGSTFVVADYLSGLQQFQFRQERPSGAHAQQQPNARDTVL